MLPSVGTAQQQSSRSRTNSGVEGRDVEKVRRVVVEGRFPHPVRVVEAFHRRAKGWRPRRSKPKRVSRTWATVEGGVSTR